MGCSCSFPRRATGSFTENFHLASVTRTLSSRRGGVCPGTPVSWHFTVLRARRCGGRGGVVCCVMKAGLSTTHTKIIIHFYRDTLFIATGWNQTHKRGRMTVERQPGVSTSNLSPRTYNKQGSLGLGIMLPKVGKAYCLWICASVALKRSLPSPACVLSCAGRCFLGHPLRALACADFPGAHARIHLGSASLHRFRTWPRLLASLSWYSRRSAPDGLRGERCL